MKKKLMINAGTALLLNDGSNAFDGYDSVHINAGSALVARKVHDKMISLGIGLNSGDMHILDIEGNITEVPANTVITASSSYNGCFIICDGNLTIEDVKGLDGITGLYAETLFYSDAVDLSGVKGVIAEHKVVYPSGAKLHIGKMTLGDDAQLLLKDGALYWVYGRVTALDGGVVEKMRQKKTSFHCRSLVIYKGLYESNKDLFKAGKYTFIPDGYAVVDDVTLDAATQLLYGEKLYVFGNLTVHHDQTEHLNGFSSLIVNETAIMPITAAAAFKAVGKANDYHLYEGVLMQINGRQTLGRKQLQTAASRGIRYTLLVNGELEIDEDVTDEDIDAIAAIYCNGLIQAPDAARGVLDSKVKKLNGMMCGNGEDGRETRMDNININCGTYRL
jgi:hypothetical protein